MANGPTVRTARLAELNVLPRMMERTQSVSELVMSLARWQCSNSTYCGSLSSIESCFEELEKVYTFVLSSFKASATEMAVLRYSGERPTVLVASSLLAT
jgi:hypothetical protein